MLIHSKRVDFLLSNEEDGEFTGLTKHPKDAIGVMALIANSTVSFISTRVEIITENQADILEFAKKDLYARFCL